jgi:uncharacterized protein (TIGR02421 family)
MLSKSKKYCETIKLLSDQIIITQKPVRVLNAIKWDEQIKLDFLKYKGKRLPKVDKDYYTTRSLGLDIHVKAQEFKALINSIKNKLGKEDIIGKIMVSRCKEYLLVVDMLASRGTPRFHECSKALFGSSHDKFYSTEPSLKVLADIINNTLNYVRTQTQNDKDEIKYSDAQAVKILNKALKKYFFADSDRITVKISKDIVADAAAGSEYIKIRKGSRFSERNLKVLEVHEGWVHLGTTLNGMSQPYCNFLSKGTPSTLIIQEGLAVIMEVFSFASHPSRMIGLSDRVHAIDIAENGGDFLDVYKYYISSGLDQEESYARAMRVFRGSLPTLGPFTKDLIYNKGFILIYNFIRLAIAHGKFDQIPLLFIGKIALEELKLFPQLIEAGLVNTPLYVPPPFDDLAAIGSWMCYSLFLNKFDLSKLESVIKF